jgi:hypothetical protein
VTVDEERQASEHLLLGHAGLPASNSRIRLARSSS